MRIMKKNGKTIIVSDEGRFWDVVDIVSGNNSYTLFKNGDAKYVRHPKFRFFEYGNKKVVATVPPKTEKSAYMVKFYNEADEGFGYYPTSTVLETNLTREVAKSIVRHLRKNAPSFCLYWMEAEMGMTLMLPYGGAFSVPRSQFVNMRAPQSSLHP